MARNHAPDVAAMGHGGLIVPRQHLWHKIEVVN